MSNPNPDQPKSTIRATLDTTRLEWALIILGTFCFVLRLALRDRYQDLLFHIRLETVQMIALILLLIISCFKLELKILSAAEEESENEGQDKDA